MRDNDDNEALLPNPAAAPAVAEGPDPIYATRAAEGFNKWQRQLAAAAPAAQKPEVNNICNHCGDAFTYSYGCTICPKCFLADHRFGVCGEHCKVTDESKAQAEVALRSSLAPAVAPQPAGHTFQQDQDHEFTPNGDGDCSLCVSSFAEHPQPVVGDKQHETDCGLDLDHSGACKAIPDNGVKSDMASECAYGFCSRPRDGCDEYCAEHHRINCVEPVVGDEPPEQKVTCVNCGTAITQNDNKWIHADTQLLTCRGNRHDGIFHAEPQLVPERIRVVVRAGKDDWIGVAYSSTAGDPSTIHEYARVRIPSDDHDWRWFDKWLRAKGETSLANRMLEEFHPERVRTPDDSQEEK